MSNCRNKGRGPRDQDRISKRTNKYQEDSSKRGWLPDQDRRSKRGIENDQDCMSNMGRPQDGGKVVKPSYSDRVSNRVQQFGIFLGKLMCRILE